MLKNNSSNPHALFIACGVRACVRDETELMELLSYYECSISATAFNAMCDIIFIRPAIRNIDESAFFRTQTPPAVPPIQNPPEQKPPEIPPPAPPEVPQPDPHPPTDMPAPQDYRRAGIAGALL
jgi:hypothetical protein